MYGLSEASAVFNHLAVAVDYQERDSLFVVGIFFHHLLVFVDDEHHKVGVDVLAETQNLVLENLVVLIINKYKKMVKDNPDYKETIPFLVINRNSEVVKYGGSFR